MKEAYSLVWSEMFYIDKTTLTNGQHVRKEKRQEFESLVWTYLSHSIKIILQSTEQDLIKSKANFQNAKFKIFWNNQKIVRNTPLDPLKQSV